MKILIDNGHGLNTLGKRSPDGTLIEAAYTRKIGRIVSYLTDRGYDAELLVPEDEDISLSERVKRVNAISSSCPAQTGHLAPNVILISIHINTAGNGSKWTNATGWSVYTCKGQTASDHLADCLCQAAIKTSQADASGQTTPTAITTGKKTSISYDIPCVLQYSPKTSLWTA